MCSDSQFQVDGGTETEKARDEKLLVMPYCLTLARRSVLEEYKDLDGR